MDFVDDVIVVYMDENGNGPEVDDMIMFLRRRLKCERRKHSCISFELCCLFVPHSSIRFLFVDLGFGNCNQPTADLTVI